ncbi:cytochrome b562 [Pseudoalteromonas sp. B28]
MKYLVIIFTLLFSSMSFAQQSVDLEINMKNTGLAYKQAVQATQLSEFNTAIDEFIELVKVSKTGKFYKKPEQSLQGLDKVIAQAELAKKAANEQGLSAAKEPLKNIDNLRKKYHELHEPQGSLNYCSVHKPNYMYL